LEVGENGTGEFRRREIRDPKEIRRPKTEEVSGIHDKVHDEVHDEGRWELKGIEPAMGLNVFRQFY
jgi:hypothetical protein